MIKVVKKIRMKFLQDLWTKSLLETTKSYFSIAKKYFNSKNTPGPGFSTIFLLKACILNFLSFYGTYFRKTLFDALGMTTKINPDESYLIPIFFEGKKYKLLIKKKNVVLNIPIDLKDPTGIVNTYGGPYRDFFYQNYLFEDFELFDWDDKKLKGDLSSTF